MSHHNPAQLTGVDSFQDRDMKAHIPPAWISQCSSSLVVVRTNEMRRDRDDERSVLGSLLYAILQPFSVLDRTCNAPGPPDVCGNTRTLAEGIGGAELVLLERKGK